MPAADQSAPASGIISTNGSQAGSEQPKIRTSLPLLQVAVAAALISKSQLWPSDRSRPLIEQGR